MDGGSNKCVGTPLDLTMLTESLEQVTEHSNKTIHTPVVSMVSFSDVYHPSWVNLYTFVHSCVLFESSFPPLSSCSAIGNKHTLETHPQEQGIDVREELLKFHASHYSANIMSLVVLGKGRCQPSIEIFLLSFSSSLTSPSSHFFHSVFSFNCSTLKVLHICLFVCLFTL